MSGQHRIRLAACMAALIGVGIAHAQTGATQAQTSLGVLWLGVRTNNAESLEAPPEWVAAVEQGLEQTSALRPIEDRDARQILAGGGIVSQTTRRLANAQRLFVAGQVAEADGVLAVAEEQVLRHLPVMELDAWLGQIESLRLLCAEVLRDDALAERAAQLLRLLAFKPSPAVAAAIERHPAPFGPAPPAPAVRIETDPPGAVVYVDLRSVGTAPLDLPLGRHPDALVDVEAPGYAKVHRTAPAAGTLALSLRRSSDLGRSVDQLRMLDELPEAELAEIGRSVAAQRLLVVRPRFVGAAGRPVALDARTFDVTSGHWFNASVQLAPASEQEPPGMLAARLLAYAASTTPPPVEKALTAPSSKPSPPAAKPSKPKVSWPLVVSSASVARPNTPKPSTAGPTATATKGRSVWRKWYTWVLAGGLAAAVVGVVVANRIGSDQITVRVTR